MGLEFYSNTGMYLNSTTEPCKFRICLVFHCSKESSIIALVCALMYIIKPVFKMHNAGRGVFTWHYIFILLHLSEI